MGYAARERPHGLQPLGAEKPLFQLFSLRDVFGQADQPDHRARLDHRKGLVVHPADRSVGPHDPVDFVKRSGHLLRRDRFGHVLAILRMDGLQP